MPDYGIVDSHVHLYDPDRFRMPWLDQIPLLNKRHAVEEYREHTAGIPIDTMVFAQVEVAPPYALLEAKWVVALAQQEPRLKALFAWAPTEDGERSRSFLEALVELGPLVKGARRITQFEADREFCLRSDFVRGCQILPEYGLTFDICINHTQLAPTIELVKRCPGTTFVLDHIGKPDIKNSVRDPWWNEMKQLAALPNAYCKVSGVVTEADHASWTLDDIRPYVERCFELFPQDRILYGGDWSVVLLSCSYRRWYESVETIVEPLSSEAKHAFWADNAKRFYRIV